MGILASLKITQIYNIFQSTDLWFTLQILLSKGFSHLGHVSALESVIFFLLFLPYFLTPTTLGTQLQYDSKYTFSL